MSIVLKMAWRNLWRKPRRTLLTVVTVALGLALLLIFLGIGDGGHVQMIESAVRMGSGHVVVQHRDYQRRRGLDRVLVQTEVDQIKGWISSMEPDFSIHHVNSRVFASGLVSSADGAAGVQVLGVQPESEARASHFDEKLVAGNFLSAQDGDEVVLGAGVAAKLSLQPGEKLVLMVQAAYSNELRSRLFRVRGILRTGLEEVDQSLLLVNLETLQQVLDLEGQVHQIALLLEDYRDSEELATRGTQMLPQLELLDWGQALPELKEFIRIDDGGNYVVNVVLFLLIAFTVLNTLLMSVLERGREFALLDSLGLTPVRRFVMVLAEAMAIAILAALLGFGLGYGMHFYLNRHGLPLDVFYSGDISAVGVTFDPVIYSQLSVERIAQATLLVFAMTLLLALVPAWRASRLVDIRLLSRT